MAVLRPLAFALAAALLFANVGIAQDASGANAEAKQADLSPEQQLDRVVNDYQQEYARIRVKLRSKETRKEASEELAALQKDCVDKVKAIAEEQRSTAVALRALETLLYPLRAPSETQAWVKKRLLEEHASDKGMVPIVAIVARDQAFLASLLEATESRDVRGIVLYNQMQAAKGRALTEENEAEVMPLMERIANEFGDVELVYPGGRVHGTLGKLVDNETFAFKNLRIGKVAPEIEGQDVEGNTFRLSDYRGKVVVIDFWGDW